MSKFDDLYPFMNAFEEHITDLVTVSKLIKAACYAAEGLEVDKVMNLLIAANEMLSYQTDLIHDDFQKVWEEFMTPHHKAKAYVTEVGEDYVVTIPDFILKELGWEEDDILDIEVLNDGTISVKRVDPTGPPGCMGDILTDEELETVKKRGIMGLTAPWD